MDTQLSTLIKRGRVVFAVIFVVISSIGVGVAIGTSPADGTESRPEGVGAFSATSTGINLTTTSAVSDSAASIAGKETDRPALDRSTVDNGTINGFVFNASGNPAGGARIVAVDTDANAHRLLNDFWWINYPSTVAEIADSPRAPGVYLTSTKTGGTFELSLPAGSYTLRAYQSSSENWFVSEDQPTVTVSASEQRQVEFTGRPPAIISIQPPLYRTDIGNSSGTQDETVEIPVELYTSDFDLGTEYERRSYNVTSARETFTFNPDVAQAVAVNGADMTVTDSSIDNNDGTVSFDARSTDPIEEGTMATVEFRLVADRSTTTHLIPDAPTTLQTTNGTVSANDGDLPSVDVGKGELVVEYDNDDELNSGVSRVAFEYANTGGRVNLEVNGDRQTAEDFESLDGQRIGGTGIGNTVVSVTPPNDSSPGTVSIAGIALTRTGDETPITSFSVGGQELMIDDVRFGPETDTEATVEFSQLTPLSGYAVGDTFTSSPSGVQMTVEPFRLSDGETYRDGTGSRVDSLPDPFSSQAGAGFRPGNVNLRFNISSVTRDTEPTETVTITRHDPETGETTNQTVGRTDTAFESADPTLPDELLASEYSPPGTNAGYTDDKRQIRTTASYPWSAVGQLQVGNAKCSAVLVEDNHILTSAHCVFDPSRPSPWASGGTTTGGAYTTFAPGANGTESPFGSVTIESIQTYQEYVETRNATYDLAVVTLASELGTQTGTFGYRAFPPESEAYTDERVHVTGYPNAGMEYVDTPDTQWDVIAHGRGTEFPRFALSDCKGTTACHELETGGSFDQTLGDGNSGGPVWDTDQNDRPVIRSLFEGSAGQYSTAVRISEDTYSDIGRMIQTGNDIELAPTARATANDTSAIGGRGVELDAINSSDPNDDPITYEWTQLSGPDVTLSEPDSATPEFTAPTDTVGELEFEVTVQDDTGRSDTARVLVTVAPGEGSTEPMLRIEPSDQTVSPNEQATYEVVLENAAEGVNAYGLTVSVDDPEVAEIAAATDETGGNTLTDLADNGSSVQITTTDGDTPDGVDVVVATLTVTGEAGGRTTSLSLSSTRLVGQFGEEYTLADTTGATVRVFEPDFNTPNVPNITNAEISPGSVTSEDIQHTLTFDANVSADGEEDEVSITLPEEVELVSVDSWRVEDPNVTPAAVIDDNTVSFSVSPERPTATADLNFTVVMTLQPRNSDFDS